MRKPIAMSLLVLLSACPERAPDPVVAPTVSIAHEPAELTDLAREALSLAPSWLRDDLAIALQRMDEADLQDEYARLLVDEGDIYLLDEIAFVIAHTRPADTA